MTAAERITATERLAELERAKALPAETLRDLRAWWTGALRREQNKVVSIAEWQRRYILWRQ